MLILSPYSKPTPDGSPNAKNYPHWQKVVDVVSKTIPVVQIGVDGEQRLDNVKAFLKPKLHELKDILGHDDCRAFASVDNFLQHYVKTYVPNLRGVVVFSRSDPYIFGYRENRNLLKDKKFLRPRNEQWWLWSQCAYDPDAYVEPSEVVDAIIEVHNSWEGVV